MKITISFTTLLTIVFIVLKLCEVIDWSWWWVLAPVWIPAALYLLAATVSFIVFTVILYLFRK